MSPTNQASNKSHTKDVISRFSPQRTFLGSFQLIPRRIRFETQESEEQVVLFLRQHFIVNVGWILSVVLLLLLPAFVLPFITTSVLLPVNMPASYFVVFPAIWYLGVVGFGFVNFLHWYFNIYIVTNERVVDIDWENLLYKKISTAKLAKIEDVSSQQGGVLGTFLNFGNVHIQTAGREVNFDFLAVPQPNTVVKVINELIS